MQRGSSSCISDHSHQVGVLVKISNRTFESTKVTGLVPARDCHDLIGGETWTCNTNQSRKSTGLPRAIGLFDDNTAVRSAAEFNPAARCDAEMIADRLWNRYLALARDCRCHHGFSRSNTHSRGGNTMQFVQLGRWLIASLPRRIYGDLIGPGLLHQSSGKSLDRF